jgi:membrane protease YdiL (CAAX protease family)
MQKYFEYGSIILLDITAIVLIAFQMKMVGWLILGVGAFSLFFAGKQFRRDIFLIYICLALLGLTPITTDTSYGHTIVMGTFLILAIVIPYTMSRYVYKDHLVYFRMHHGRNWYKSEIFYIFLTAVVTYFLFPIMLRSSGSYLNWTVEPGTDNLLRLFIGTNALGIWDELFFVSTTLGILRRHLTFPFANLAQSILFTSFLYELGFRGWAFLIIFVFALLQGYIFKKTDSLFYVITIHLVADFILYLTLIYLHHPDWISIFAT